MLVHFTITVDVSRAGVARRDAERFVAALKAAKGRVYDASMLVVRGDGRRVDLEREPIADEPRGAELTE